MSTTHTTLIDILCDLKPEEGGEGLPILPKEFHTSEFYLPI